MRAQVNASTRERRAACEFEARAAHDEHVGRDIVPRHSRLALLDRAVEAKAIFLYNAV